MARREEEEEEWEVVGEAAAEEEEEVMVVRGIHLIFHREEVEMGPKTFTTLTVSFKDKCNRFSRRFSEARLLPVGTGTRFGPGRLTRPLETVEVMENSGQMICHGTVISLSIAVQLYEFRPP